VLAEPAAGSVLEMGGTVRRLNCSCIFPIRRVLSLLLFFSGRSLLSGGSLSSGSNGPDGLDIFLDCPMHVSVCIFANVMRDGR
jgi:hypothetical protein